MGEELQELRSSFKAAQRQQQERVAGLEQVRQSPLGILSRQSRGALIQGPQSQGRSARVCFLVGVQCHGGA